jgi:hypothetical protein
LSSAPSPRIRLRQKAGFGGQERGEVDFKANKKAGVAAGFPVSFSLFA